MDHAGEAAVRRRDGLVRPLQVYATEADRLGREFAERHGLHATDLAALSRYRTEVARVSPRDPGR